MDATDGGVEYLVKKHPEIEKFHSVPPRASAITHVGLCSVLSLHNLSSLIIRGINSTIPDKVYNGTLSCLTNLNLGS